MAPISRLRCKFYRRLQQCCLILAAVCPARLHSVEITLQQHEGKRILYIRGGIDSGDGARVRRALQQYSFDQVWLSSPGGNLYEGVMIGTYLREKGAFVRVRQGDACVSACTVAFVGGLLRSVDAAASYEVHAYSGVRSELRPDSGESQAALQARILANPRAYLTGYAHKEMSGQYGGVFWSSSLYLYFRLMIQPAARPQLHTVFDSSEQRAVANALKRYAERAYQQYLNGGGLDADVKRIEKEGLAAAHEIAMRLERDAMQAMLAGLHELERNNALKHRSAKAIRMLATMFESRILATSQLSVETLSEYGYTNVPILK